MEVESCYELWQVGQSSGVRGRQTGPQLNYLWSCGVTCQIAPDVFYFPGLPDSFLRVGG